MMTADQNRGFELAVLLGAGASVEAGVPTTVKFADQFLARVRESSSGSDEGRKDGEALDAILPGLVAWLEGQGRVLDIEAIYEFLIRLDSPTTDYFVNAVLSDPSHKVDVPSLRRLRTELEEFIRAKTWVDAAHVPYLEPLLGLTPPDAPLRVFSTNYDTCIEALCTARRLRWSDGFSPFWDPAAFRSKGLHVVLHKLHGSVLWYRDEHGGYFSSALRPSATSGAPLQSFYSRCDPLLIFPARKESNEAPLADNLSILRRFLSRRDRRAVLVVLGYSFRDEQIRRVVLDGLNQNRHLHVLLVDPDASGVRDRLAGEMVLPWRVRASDLSARVHVLADTASSEPLTKLHRSVIPRFLAIAADEMDCSARLEVDPNRWHEIAKQFRDIGMVDGFYRNLARARDLGLPSAALQETTLLPLLRELAYVVASGCHGAPDRNLAERIEFAGRAEITDRLMVYCSGPGETLVAGVGLFGPQQSAAYSEVSAWLDRLSKALPQRTALAAHVAETSSATAELADLLATRCLPNDRVYQAIEDPRLGSPDRERLHAERERARSALHRLQTVAAAVSHPRDRSEESA